VEGAAGAADAGTQGTAGAVVALALATASGFQIKPSDHADWLVFNPETDNLYLFHSFPSTRKQPRVNIQRAAARNLTFSKPSQFLLNHKLFYMNYLQLKLLH
jgi:hypothetical protein